MASGFRHFFCLVEDAFTLACYNYLIISAINDGAWRVVTRTTVDDDVNFVLVALVDFFGVGEIAAHFVFVIDDGGGHEGRTELFDEVGDDGLVGDADADGLFLALEDARHVVVGVEDESESARQVAFHHLEDVVADGGGVI